MAFDGVKYVDASQSTFNNVGHDQINHNIVNVNFICTYPSYQSLHHVNLDPLWPVSGGRQMSQENDYIFMYDSSKLISVVRLAADLIDKIVQLLPNDRETVDRYRDLKQELESLHLSLLLSGHAIHAFKHTLLDESLAKTINSEVGRCFMTLREMFDNIKRYQQGLQSTSINYLWPQVYWSRWGRSELAQLREKLSTHRDSLDELLIALNWCVLLLFHP
jgi:hypothetical protein